MISRGRPPSLPVCLGVLLLAGCATLSPTFHLEDEAQFPTTGRDVAETMAVLGFHTTDSAPRHCGAFRLREFECTRYAARLAGLEELMDVARAPYALPLPAVDPHLGVLYEASSAPEPAGASASGLTVERKGPLAGAEFGWVPLEQTIDGPRVAEAWEHLARVGTPFACSNMAPAGAEQAIAASAPTTDTVQPTSCTRLLVAATPHDEPGIAACNVVRLPKGRTGAPYHCTFVLLARQGKTYIRAATAFFNHSYAFGGRPDLFIELPQEMSMGVNDSAREATIVRLLSEALQRPPFKLTIQRDQHDVMAISDYHYSDVLRQWAWETIRIRPYGLITVSTTLYVSRQNSDNPADWDRPSPQVETAYLAALTGVLRASIGSLCKQGSWEQQDKRLKLTCLH